MAEVQAKIPVLLMVSGGSDSTALLELVCAYVAGEDSDDELFAMLADSLPAPDCVAPFVLHVNHMLRGEDSDGDERFVRELCEKLDVPCEVQRVDIGALARSRRGGMEAIAREERYRLASSALDLALRWAQRTGSSAPRIRLMIASRPSSCALSWEQGLGVLRPSRAFAAICVVRCSTYRASSCAIG